MESQNKTYVITGATSGIGMATAEVLAKSDAIVIGIGRSPERCRQGETILRMETRNDQIYYLTADLSTQAGVRSAADQVNTLLDKFSIGSLDGLVNNAGTFTWWMSLTEDGIETQWALNHLSPYLLTRLLLPRLEKSPAGRVVTVSSGSHYGGRINWADPQLRRCYNGLAAYQNTKLANVLFTSELNRRLPVGSTVQAFAADPGLVHTDIGAKGTPGFVRWFWRVRSAGGVEPEVPARAIAYLLTTPGLDGAKNPYWYNFAPKQPSQRALDLETARSLWKFSASQCGLTEEL
jgi:NAD(P)-dependent dehydrogenase (short-subunit alcohol dehydrogenase family)